MNKEQLEFFYNEIMGLLGWDDGDEASGVDPLLWAKKQISDLRVIITRLRAERDDEVWKTVTAEIGLNIRDGSSIGRIVGYLRFGQRVRVLESVNGWARIGDNQWCSEAYLR